MLKLLRNSLCGLALGLTFADASLAADSERNFDMYLEDDLLGHQSFRVIDDEGVEREVPNRPVVFSRRRHGSIVSCLFNNSSPGTWP